MQRAYWILLSRKEEEEINLGDLGIDGRIKLKSILNKWVLPQDRVKL
jgi:hypothetical protein